MNPPNVAPRPRELAALAAVVALGVVHAMIAPPWSDASASILTDAVAMARGDATAFTATTWGRDGVGPAWSVAISLAVRLGASASTVAVGLATTAFAGAIVAAWAVARRIAPAPARVAPLAAATIAASPVLARHAASGLETPLLALAVLAAAWTALHEHPRVAMYTGAWLALAAVTRVEGLTMAVIACAALIGMGESRRRGVLALGSFVSLWFPTVVLPWILFDALTLAPAGVLDPDPTRWGHGIAGAARALATTGAMIGVAALAVTALRRGRDLPTVWFAAIVGTGFVLAIGAGGDALLVERALTPALAVAAPALAPLIGDAPTPRGRAIGAFGLAAALLIPVCVAVVALGG